MLPEKFAFGDISERTRILRAHLSHRSFGLPEPRQCALARQFRRHAAVTMM
jgi:hypothetical protein